MSVSVVNCVFLEDIPLFKLNISDIFHSPSFSPFYQSKNTILLENFATAVIA